MPSSTLVRTGTFLALLCGSLARAQPSWIDDPKPGPSASPKDRTTRVYLSSAPLQDASLEPWAEQLAAEHPSPMLTKLLGIAAVIADEPKSASPKPTKPLEQLRKAGTGISVPKALADRATTFAWLRATSATASRDIEILTLPDGGFAYRRDARTLLRLKPEAIAPFSLRWNLTPAVPDDRLKPAETIACPAQPSLWVFDSRLLTDRIRPSDATIAPAARANGKDTVPNVWIRLPRTNAKSRHTRPPGVLIWCDASDSGNPPASLAAACDELNLIAAGSPQAGNERPVADRFQRAFDALATVQHLAPVDHERLYITGISGGGRLSSALALCFPDLFTGAAPIVGLACYKNVPDPGPLRKLWPALFRKPSDQLWKLATSRRIAVLTGDLDFNFVEINAASALMKADGLTISVFAYPDMAHTMPTPDRFTEALKWVDAPVAAARSDADAAAAALLSSWKAKSPTVNPATARPELLAVMDRSPWSPAAVEAAALLGLWPTKPN